MAWAVTGVTAPTVTGPTAVPTSLTSITTSTVFLAIINFSNTTSGPAVSRTFTLTDTAGNAIRTAIEVAPGVDYYEEFAMLQCVGLKWVASGAGLVGQVQEHH